MAASVRKIGLHQLPRIMDKSLSLTIRYPNRLINIHNTFHDPCKLSMLQVRSGPNWYISRRHQYTYRTRFFRGTGRQALDTEEKCESFAASLLPNERSLVLSELQKLNEQVRREGKSEIEPPSKAQLRLVLLSNGIPFIGFGFLDNAIMIVAGDYIDLTIGITLGISTMAAAALGNLISDLAGVGLAGYVEALAARVGVHPKELTPEQADMRKTRWMAGIGRALGLTIGCLLGMFPLLFLETRREAEEPPKEGATEAEQSQTRG